MLYERRANVRLIRLSGQQSALKRLEDHKILLYGIHNYISECMFYWVLCEPGVQCKANKVLGGFSSISIF